MKIHKSAFSIGRYFFCCWNPSCGKEEALQGKEKTLG